MQDQNNAKQLVVERLRQATNVLVTVENNPSVDELAAALALALYLNKLEKHATAVFSGAVPPAINFLEPNKTFEHNLDSLRDFIIALDKDKADRLRYKVEDDVVKVFITPYRTPITQKDLQFSQGDFNIELIVALGVQKQESLDKAITAHGRILHDATVITINARPEPSALGSVDWQNGQASSISEMVAELAEAIQPNTIDQQIGTALLTGVVAATDRFSNEHTSPHAMNVAAQLMAAGANQKLIADNLQKSMAGKPTAVAAAVVPVKSDDDSGKIEKGSSSDEKELPKAEGKDEGKGELKLGHRGRKKEEAKDKPQEKPEEKQEEKTEEPPKDEGAPAEGEKPPMPPPPPAEGGEGETPPASQEAPAEPAPEESQPENQAAPEDGQPDVPANSDQALAQAVESAANLPAPAPEETQPAEPQPSESPADSAPADMPTPPAAQEESAAPSTEAESGQTPEQELPQNILPGELPRITPLSTHSSADRALEPPKMGGTLSATTAEAEEAKRLEEEARRNQTLLSHSAPVQPSIEAPGVESAASSAMPEGGGFVAQDQPSTPAAAAQPTAEAELEAARKAVDDALNGQMSAAEAQSNPAAAPEAMPAAPAPVPIEQSNPAPMPAPAPAPQQGLPPMPDFGALPPPPPLPPLPGAAPIEPQPQPGMMPPAQPAQPPQMPTVPEQQPVAPSNPAPAPLPPTQPQTAAPAPGQVVSDPNDPNQFRIPGQ